VALVFGLTFNHQVLMPALVLGVAAAGLYGLLAVTLVLTYRVSRTIGFVQGGIAVLATYLYYYLTAPLGGGCNVAGESRSCTGPVPGALMVIAVGAIIGAVYGLTVTGKRMAGWPSVVLTTYSLAWYLTLIGITFTTISVETRQAPSVFGPRRVRLFGASVTVHQVATVVLLIVLVTVLSVVLQRTRTGIHIRAIADDVEATRFLGIPLSRVGTGVYAFSGALAGLAGVLLASALGPDPTNLLFVFMRALIVAVLGGFTSMTLALVGSLLLAVAETVLTAGVFGNVPVERREIIVMTAIFALVFLINRLRPVRVIEATGF
jgi:branched-chain amino acid transport system permease protein